MRRVFFAFASAAILASVILGVATRRSFHSVPTDVAALSDYRVEMASSKWHDESREYTEAELDNAEFVARIVFTGERIHTYQSMLSTVTVLEVYTGDQSYTGKTMPMFEVNHFNAEYHLYRNFSYANLMLPDREYLAFCKIIENPYDKENPVRLRPARDLGLSVFRLEENSDVIFDAEKAKNRELTYGDTLSSEFICFSQEQLDGVLRLKQKYLDKYGV